MMTENTLVAVFDAPDEIQALLYRTMLEEAGIPVMERPMEAEWLEGVMQQGLHSQLLVREGDAEEARRLVEDFRREADEGILSAEIPDESKNKTDGDSSAETPDTSTNKPDGDMSQG